MQTFSCKCGAEVIRTRIAVVALFGRVRALARGRVTGIIRTEVLVLAILWLKYAPFVRVAGILGAKIFVVAKKHIKTLALPLHALRRNGAGIVIVA